MLADRLADRGPVGNSGAGTAVSAAHGNGVSIYFLVQDRGYQHEVAPGLHGAFAVGEAVVEVSSQGNGLGPVSQAQWAMISVAARFSILRSASRETTLDHGPGHDGVDGRYWRFVLYPRLAAEISRIDPFCGACGECLCRERRVRAADPVCQGRVVCSYPCGDGWKSDQIVPPRSRAAT